MQVSSATLAGGSSQNASTDLQGSFSGITLSTTRDDLLRAVLEGVALDLGCYCLGALQKQVRLEDRMLLCGGGARSPLWRQIFADVFGMPILKSSVDQDAASLGAAAIAARAAGFWSDYSRVDALHRDEGLQAPDLEHQALYAGLKSKYRAWTDCLADLKGRRTS